ncbi:MAG: thiolase family protein [Candidatus Caldarchaeum sp.]|uniref:Thiolase family protein n=1 Tax=Caldiarchaeum subterraneum TaxID=311458 RepID=A0A7C5QJ23_CALS0
MKAFLCGGAVLKVDEHWDKSLPNLLAEAGLKALDSSGISYVDHVYVANVYGEVLQEQANLGSLLAEELGLRGVAASRVEAGGASGLAAVYAGCLAVSSGLANAVLVVGAEKMSDGTVEEAVSLLTMEERQDYVGYLGVSQLAEAALLYKEYVKRYRISNDDVAYFPVISHENSSTAPHAQYQFKISLETVINSPYVAEPLHRLETTSPSDGAAAILIVSQELARRVKEPKCLLTGIGSASDLMTAFDREDPLEMRGLADAGKRALEMAGIKASDVDFLELHDPYSILAPLSLEALGIAEKGQACLQARKGRFSLSGEKPINTFGGLKGRGYPVGASGVYAVVEAFMQLTDNASKNQVPGADVGLVESLSGLGSYAGVAVLERMR